MAIIAVGIVVAFLVVILMNVGGYISQIVGFILYGISVPMMWLLDFVQVLFRKLAGLGTTYIRDANHNYIEQNDDIVFSLLTSQTVLEVFMAMLIVGVALLIITSIIQMIRTEYTTEGSKNSKTTILGTALKAFAYFFITPVAVVFGIIMANYLLKAIDVATSAKGARTIAGSVFVAAASDGNRVRNDINEGWYMNLLDGAVYGYTVHFNGKNFVTHPGASQISDVDDKRFHVNDTGSDEQNREIAANKIDNAFSSGSLLSVLAGGGPTWWDDSTDVFPNGKSTSVWLSYDNPITVSRYYKMSEINYLLLYVGLAICIVTLFKACFGMIKRMYTVTMLFIISPGIIGIWPLDGGNAFKSWRQKFISSVLSAYGVVVALNLYFVIVGVIDNIYLFSPYATYSNVTIPGISHIIATLMFPVVTLINAAVRALFIIVGALMITEFSGTVSSLIGADDGLKEGGDMAGKVKGAVGKGAMVAMGGAAIAGKVAGKVGGAIGKIPLGKGRTVGSGLKSVGNKFANTRVGGAITRATGSVVNRMMGMTGADAHELRQLEATQAHGGKLTAEQQTRLQQLQETRTAMRAQTSGRFNAMSTYAFRNSGTGKALNEMTGGLFAGLGGENTGKVDAIATQQNGAHSTYTGMVSAYRDNATERRDHDNKKEAEDHEKRFDNATKVAEQIQAFNDGKKEYEKRDNAGNLVHKELHDVVESFKRIKEQIKSGASESTIRTSISDYNRQAGLIGAGTINADQILTKGSSNADRIRTLNAQVDGNIKATADTFANDKFTAENLVTRDARTGDVSVNETNAAAMDVAAEQLKKAGADLVTAADRLAKANSANEKGKPEVAINRMTSEMTRGARETRAREERMVQLLEQLVNNSHRGGGDH